ncbi:hypothetical protein R5R73_04850 [Salinicola sp. LHM]|uniref:hypothetical protein n=1 Tax=Salinicola sp. LHM TaxID=3065298 RepID=UPI002ACE6553|nr:hypothetical protein [Salinicola sp. LHM]WQH34018.1 hypothetical protein R5R73_04850 [Salinicola sp. LHM]
MIIRWFRGLSRDSRSHLLVAAVCFAWAVSSQMQVSSAYHRLDATQASQQAVGYGLWYALIEEQEKAGGFEAQRNIAREKVGDLRYQLGVADTRLAACQATTNMATDDGFTGELLLRTERK